MNQEDKNEILSLSKDLGEAAIDSVLEDGIFKDIPIIGIGISVIKLINSASDRILLSKIIHFINDLNLKNQDEIDEFKENYFKNHDYKKIGSKILLILERADNLTKIEWLAKSLRLFVDNTIDKNQFLRISSIINSAYTEDVEHLTVFDQRSEITSTNDLIQSYILDHLFSVGLLESHGFDGGNVAGLNSGTIYALNKFGELMKDKIVKTE
ncbi:MAG: hypothetical protein ABI378_14670 [Chitinophagaceae bacterium]